MTKKILTLKEAVEYLKRDTSGVVFNQLARQLGIEALEKEKNTRACHKILYPADHCKLPLLPSEKEEK